MLTDLPNVLTLSRIAAIPLLVLLVALHEPRWDLAACVLFAAAAITDYFDGKLARDRRQFSDFGRMLDPIADKLLVGAALMLLAGLGRVTAWGLYPAIVILLREILVSGLREYLGGIRISLPVTRLAKWKTGFQMGALGVLLAGDETGRLLGLGFLPVGAIGILMLWVAAILTLVTGWDYLVTGIRHAAGHPSEAALPVDGAPRDLTGGWYNAGDFGKWTQMAAISASQMMWLHDKNSLKSQYMTSLSSDSSTSQTSSISSAWILGLCDSRICDGGCGTGTPSYRLGLLRRSKI